MLSIYLGCRTSPLGALRALSLNQWWGMWTLAHRHCCSYPNHSSIPPHSGCSWRDMPHRGYQQTLPYELLHLKASPVTCGQWTKMWLRNMCLFLLIFYNHRWLVTIWMWTTPFHRPGFCTEKGGTGWAQSTTLCFLTTNKKWDPLQHAPVTVPFLLL